jgi:hypothetical protein
MLPYVVTSSGGRAKAAARNESCGQGRGR